MAVDARIPLGVTPMQIESPTDQMGKALQLRASHDQMRKGQMEQEAYERGLQEEQALRSYFASGKPVQERELFGIVGPTRGAAILKGMADLKSAQVKTEGELKTVVGSALGAIEALPENLRPEAYQSMRQSFIERGWSQPGDMPEQYAPEVLARARQWAMTPVQQSEHADRVADNARLDQDQADKRPGVQAASTAQVQATLASQFQGAPDQAAWDVIYAKATEAGLGHLFHPKMSRAAIAKAQHAGMKAEQVLASQVAQQNANTDAAQAGEQARHNRVMESRQSEPLEAIIGPDGKPVMVPRSQAIGKMPATNRDRPTEDERKTAGFYKQMRDAITTLDEVEAQLTEKELYQIQTLPQDALIGMANRGQMSEAAKRYLRAFEQFTEARLRPVSGAAISDSEFARDRRTYARQYSETPTLNQDRRRAREGALDSLRTRAGVLAPKDDAPNDGPQEGAEQPIPGVPGGVAKFQGGKWVRIK